MRGDDVFDKLKEKLDRFYQESGAQVVEVRTRDGRNYVGRRGAEFVGPILHVFNGWAGRTAGELPGVVEAAVDEKVAKVRTAMKDGHFGLIQ